MTENITRIEVFCLDKKAGDILRAISGMAIKAEAVPVANGQVRNGKVEATNNGELVNMFAKFLAKRKVKKTNAGMTREFLQSIGQPVERYSYLLRKAGEYGVLKKVGKGKQSAYNVLQGGR